MYPHIPDIIRHEFESSHQSGVKCETTLKRGRKVIIYLATTQKNIEIYLQNIIAWLNFASEIASHKCAQTLHIYLLLTDAKKRLPDIDAEPIDQINANTAFTTSCSSTNDIFVYRREEWFKVLMHETFHCLGLDFSASTGDESNRRILSTFKAVDPITDIRFYETFCEMWAEVFNIMFCLFMNRHGKCAAFSNSKYFAALQRERRFSIYQSNKILRRAGYNYKSIFENPLNNHPKYRENTHAISYYVIKSIMLWNLDRYVKWCEMYCKENLPPIQFNHKYIAEYCDLVDDLVENDGGYGNTAEKINTTTYMRGGSDQRSNPDLSDTLRMTSIDPQWY